MALPTQSASWRDSARYPRFFFLDSRAVFPLLAFLLHIRIWTFVVAVLFTLFFSTLMRFGLTLPIFWRLIRSFIGGRRKMSRPWWV